MCCCFVALLFDFRLPFHNFHCVIRGSLVLAINDKWINTTGFSGTSIPVSRLITSRIAFRDFKRSKQAKLRNKKKKKRILGRNIKRSIYLFIWLKFVAQLKWFGLSDEVFRQQLKYSTRNRQTHVVEHKLLLSTKPLPLFSFCSKTSQSYENTFQQFCKRFI